MAAADVYDAIPKVELHCHVEGTVRPSTVVELARKNGRPLRSEDPTELYRYTSLNSFLAIFWLVQELLADRDDRIEPGTGSTRENVLQQCATVQLRKLFGRAESAGFAGCQDYRGDPGGLAR